MRKQKNKDGYPPLSPLDQMIKDMDIETDEMVKNIENDIEEFINSECTDSDDEPDTTEDALSQTL